jgi:tetratricopeptide (TPR) repeat protein
MKTRRVIATAVLLLIGGAAGYAAAKVKASASMYGGKAPNEAASSLLQGAEALAGKGSWELIYVGRTHYLGGQKAEGQAIFDRVLGPKAEGGDYVRVGRAYWEAGEWDKARPLFDKALALAPKDADWLAEIGAYYNLKGDRAHAEELFARSLAEDSENPYNAAKMGGSYIGVAPD